MFSIVLIPDTQNLSNSATWIAHFQAAADWIVANQVSRNIELVLGLGDVTETASDTEFGRVETPMDTIWATNIPFIAAIGNHDYNTGTPDATHSNTSQWNAYFGTGKYTGRSWWDGAFETGGKSENMYARVDVGGRPTLIVCIEVYPRPAVLAWADGIVAANPDHDVILITHAYLDYTGLLVEDGDTWGPTTYFTAAASSSGVEMWAELKTRPNVIAVFNAHFLGGNVAVLEDDGDEGNSVFQQFTNWQLIDEGGDGRIVILTVDEDTGWATREVYNARTDSFESAYDLTFQFYLQGDSAPSAVVNATTASSPVVPTGRRVVRSPRYGVTRVTR